MRLDEPTNIIKEREIKLKYLSGDMSINLLKTTKMMIESLREEMTEVKISAMGKSLLSLMSQMTSDKIQPEIRSEHNRIYQAQEYLNGKLSRVLDDSDIVLSGETY